MSLKRCRRFSQQHPNVVYIILGATHPNLIARDGEILSAQAGAPRGGSLLWHRNVIFYNRFVTLEELKEFIGAADIYITPYLNESQITSGTLAYTFRRWQSSHFHTLLACEGVAGERARHPGAVRESARRSLRG